jgi:hypothetical protein
MIGDRVEFFSITSMDDKPIGWTVPGILALAGGVPAVARACGVSVQSVSKWGRRVPDRHAQRVAVLAGLPLEIVRPDLVRSGHELAVRFSRRRR